MAMETWQKYRYSTETPPDLYSGYSEVQLAI